MRLYLRIFTFAAACILGAGAFAQTPNLEPKTPHDARVPTITYELVFPGEVSPRHVISVDSAGNAAYRSRTIGSGERTGEAHIVKFTMPQPTCTRIFELAQQANYFGGKSVSGSATLDPASSKTSTKFTTLTYSYGPTYSFDDTAKHIRNSMTFTRSADPVIQQLTSIFEGIAGSFERGRTGEAANPVQ